MQADFLPADAISVLVRYALSHPVGALGAILLVTAVFYGWLQWRFKRQGSDLLTLSVALAITSFFVVSCIYLLKTKPGYRFLGDPNNLFRRTHFRP